MKKNIIYLFVLFLTSFISVAQQYKLKGDAIQINTTTYEITPDRNRQSGLITNYYPLDLTKNFEIDFEMYFGINDNGADGMTFTLTNNCNPALSNGGGLGVLNIPNSLIVEFDTYNNGSDYFDNTPNDHISIFKNGLFNNANFIMDGVRSPVSCLTSKGNIENGTWWPIKIKWEYISATSQKISVFFNNSLRGTSTKNHVANSFAGSTNVFHSYSGSTGLYKNLQRVRIANSTNNNFNICSGASVVLNAPLLGSNYVWTTGSSTTNINTIVPTQNDIVSCTYFDYCGLYNTVAFNINLFPDVVVNTSIASNSPICSNQNAIFTITGTSGNTFYYNLNNGATQNKVISASGTSTIEVNNATSNQTLNIVLVSSANCNNPQTSTETIVVKPLPITSSIIQN